MWLIVVPLSALLARGINVREWYKNIFIFGEVKRIEVDNTRGVVKVPDHSPEDVHGEKQHAECDTAPEAEAAETHAVLSAHQDDHHGSSQNRTIARNNNHRVEVPRREEFAPGGRSTGTRHASKCRHFCVNVIGSFPGMSPRPCSHPDIAQSRRRRGALGRRPSPEGTRSGARARDRPRPRRISRVSVRLKIWMDRDLVSEMFSSVYLTFLSRLAPEPVGQSRVIKWPPPGAFYHHRNV